MDFLFKFFVTLDWQSRHLDWDLECCRGGCCWWYVGVAEGRWVVVGSGGGLEVYVS